MGTPGRSVSLIPSRPSPPPPRSSSPWRPPPRPPARSSIRAGSPPPPSAPGSLRPPSARTPRPSSPRPRACDLAWNTLAGIGWVESQHGTLDGRTLGEDGRADRPVTGPALDGDGFAAVPATGLGTAWHGDPEWEHAVGPLQFLPSTWARWGADGDGDGLADPHDLDDAAAAAVAYLCADGHDLTSGAGWSAAVFGYNHDAAYVAAVQSAAATYADRTG